jgi:hypothetical protein
VVIRVGYTGTRRGMTLEQKVTLRRLLIQTRNGTDDSRAEFHHGDCIGGDAEGAWIATAIGYRIIGHPPTDPKFRAFFPSDEELDPLPYLQRDQVIVDTGGFLLACPHGPETRRSGTWTTVRMARRAGLPRIIIEPDGTHHRDTQ